MPLHLIQGPLNSGRTGRIRALVAAQSHDSPVIVAPTADARYALEAELCESAGAAIGPWVTGFLDLAETVARAAGATVPPIGSAVQRRHLLDAVTATTDLGILAASAARPGFTNALERLLSELRSAGVKPGQSQPEDPYLAEILALYDGYVEALDRAGLTDQAGLIDIAATALRANPDSWTDRPVFMHGFDDLSPDQLRLVRALAEATEVTISLTFEDREALRARSRLRGLLVEEVGGEVIEAMPPVPAFTPNPLLFHLERHFGELPTAVPPPPLAGTGVRIILASGLRGEAEAVATEIKQLIVAGTPASRIAIALRTPNRQGPQFAEALRAAGVPVALETEISATATATGQAVADLIAAALSGLGTAEALVRLARGPGLGEIDPELADRLERAVRQRRVQGSDEALAQLDEEDRGRFGEIAAARQAAASGLVALAEWLADFAGRAAARIGGDLEVRAARAIATTATELAPLATDQAELLAGVLATEVRTWTGPTGGRVRIASPYTLRTTRFEHLFVCSLQEGEFPRRGGEGPFLSEAQRTALGLAERADPEAEEMYLFQVCLSLPEHGLWLSARTADADGRAEQPSPYLAEVKRLAGDAAQTMSYDLSDLTPPPERATSETQLAQALLLAGQPSASEFLADSDRATRIERRIAAALRRNQLAARPRPLRHPAVLKDLSQRRIFGATGLEAFLRYPYHWFIGRELDPQPLERDDEYLTDGSIAHAVLQRLYEERTAGTERPSPGNLTRWLSRCDQLLDEEARKLGLNRKFIADRIRLRRLTGFLRAFVTQEAEHFDLAVSPAMFEASFGGDGEEAPTLTHGDWSLTGKIDRVDLTADGNYGLLHDYKYSASATPVGSFERTGSLQLPLYLAALDRVWGIKPLGGLYHPLRAKRGTPPRGMLSASAVEGPLAGIRFVKTDLLGDAEMKLLIEATLDQASDVVARLRAGAIDGEPLPDAFTNVPGWAAIDRRAGRVEVEENGR